MIKLIKRLIFAWRFKRAVKKANELHNLFGLKYYVINMGGKLKVVPKKTIKHLVATRRFRKGVTAADIEKRALFVTQ